MTQEQAGASAPRSLPTLDTMVFTRGSGADLYDRDGVRHTDFICGYGPVVLGHGHPAVVEAVARQAARGTLFPAGSDVLEEFLALMADTFPGRPGALPFKTGSEAVAAALRLARGATGRHTVLRVGFHGWHDPVVTPHVSWHRYDHTERTAKEVPAVPPVYGQVMRVWHGSDPDDLVAAIAATPDLAAVLLDPVELARPMPENARRVLAATREAGALLVLDESKTCLRLGPHGAQGRLGITPDLTVAGKALANGFPLAVVLADAALTSQARKLRIRGTFSYELGALAASIATLRVLREEKAGETLEASGRALLDALNAALAAAGAADRVAAVPYPWPCMPYLAFRDVADAERRDFYSRLTGQGVLMLPNHMNFMSLAHEPRHIAHAAEAVAVAAAALTAP